MKKIISICLVIISFILGIIITFFYLNKKTNMEVLKDSLVYIESINNEYINTGTGFVYKKEKGYDYILTNYHIIEDYNKIYIYNKNKEKVNGKVEFFDKNKDIAIIKIENKLNLKKIKLGNSSKIKVTDEVYTLGIPIDFRYFGTFSKGIISSINRKIKVDNNTYDTIQVDTNISLGNSGSPLINKNGEVIGIVFVTEEDINGISFAIPINDIIKILE